MKCANAGISAASRFMNNDVSMSRPIVLDTNVVLDLLLFADPDTGSLRAALQAKQVRWIATAVMREELARVLTYEHIMKRMDFYQRNADGLLAAFDAQARLVEVAPKAAMNCKDPDDQKFIDLAVAHGALLLSKDNAVLKLRKRLALHNVVATTHF